MKQKNKLSKIAFTAMVLAAASPMVSEAADHFGSHETFLAKGCAAHGCAASSSASTDSYSTSANTYKDSTESTNAHKDTTGATYKGATATKGAANRNQSSSYEHDSITSGTSSSYNGTPRASSSYNGEDANDNLSYIESAKTPKTAQMNYGADQMSYETYRYQNDWRPHGDRYYYDRNYYPQDRYYQGDRYQTGYSQDRARQVYVNPGYNQTYNTYETSAYPYGAEYGGSSGYYQQQPYQGNVRVEYTQTNPAQGSKTQVVKETRQVYDRSAGSVAR